MSDVTDYDYADQVLKKFNPEIYELECSISREGYTAKCSDFEDALYEEEYSLEMIYRIDEIQWKLKSIEDILEEEENEGL